MPISSVNLRGNKIQNSLRPFLNRLFHSKKKPLEATRKRRKTTTHCLFTQRDSARLHIGITHGASKNTEVWAPP